MQVKSITECSKHSAILSTFIKLPFVIKIFGLSISEWPFHTSFTVHYIKIFLFPVILVIACLVGITALPLSITTTLGPPLQLDNDGNYTMAWVHNDTHIVFEVKVKTTGYVGFGISHNGKMFPSDVVIGWIKDGNTFFTVSFMCGSRAGGGGQGIQTHP